jgi:hypothetical protein
MNYFAIGVTAGAFIGAAFGVLSYKQLIKILPHQRPIVAEHVHAERKGNLWRVSEDIVAFDTCRLVLLERRFKDEELDRWKMLDPIGSSPAVMGGGIARADIKKGRAAGWAEYDVPSSGLVRGIYTVNVTATECEETGFEGSYALIPAVPYDFTEPALSTAPLPPAVAR